MVSSGINISARREIDKNAFSKMLGGDGAATDFLDWVKQSAAETPMGYDDLTQMSRRLKSFGYDTEDVKDMLLTIGDTGAGTGSDTYGMQMMINGLGRIKQSGKTNLEYMNPMIERGVPVWEYLQKGLEKDTGESLSIQDVQKKSSLNEIDSEKAVSYIMTGMKQDFGGLLEQRVRFMAVKVILKEQSGRASITFPVTPPSFSVSVGQVVQTVHIHEVGDVTLAGQRRLGSIKLSVLLPRQSYSFASSDRAPYDYIAQLTRWVVQTMKAAKSCSR